MKERIHFPHSVVVRSPGLLPMLYTVSELSTLLQVPDRTLRDWLAVRQSPHIMDSNHHIWIVGTKFAAWVAGIQLQKTRSKSKLPENEAYCFRCRRRVTLQNSRRKQIQGNLTILQGHCPNCGCAINRGSRKRNDPESAEG